MTVRAVTERTADKREKEIAEAFDAVEDGLRRVRRFGRWLPMWSRRVA